MTLYKLLLLLLIGFYCELVPHFIHFDFEIQIKKILLYDK